MEQSPRLQSLFSQKLDRAVFASYFLGAIVPLIALAAVVQRYAAPALEREAYGSQAVIAGMVAVTLLTLASFFALRRLTHAAVARMDADNERLARILDASRALSDAPHADAVSQTALGCARALTGADAGYLLLARDDKPLALCESTGDRAERLYEARGEELCELAEQAIREGRASACPSFPAEDERSDPLALAVIPLSGEGDSEGAIVLARSGGRVRFDPEEIDALSTLAALTNVALHNTGLREAQRNFFAHVTEILVAALDAHVDNRVGHSTQVAQLSNRIGRELSMPEPALQRLHFASLLHDIGMLRIDRAHQLRETHFRKHPLVGHRMLSRIKLWQDVAPIVLHHHERWDGAGYPEGLAGDAIPLESRILCAADAFDAMRRDESHRAALSVEEIMTELERCRGSQFDPKVVEALKRLAERGELPD